MHKAQFRCERCDRELEAEVLDRDNEKDRETPRRPLKCPYCQSTKVKEKRRYF